MSYLVTENFGGNLHVAAQTINDMGIARNVLAMDFSGSATVVVFRVEDYPDYVRLCKALHREPKTTKEFFR